MKSYKNLLVVSLLLLVSGFVHASDIILAPGSSVNVYATQRIRVYCEGHPGSQVEVCRIEKRKNDYGIEKYFVIAGGKVVEESSTLQDATNVISKLKSVGLCL